MVIQYWKQRRGGLHNYSITACIIKNIIVYSIIGLSDWQSMCGQTNCFPRKLICFSSPWYRRDTQEWKSPST